MKFFLSLLCALCVLRGESSSAATTKEAFEQAATQLKFLAAGDLLYDRFPDRVIPREDLETHNKIVADLFARPDSFDDLTPLLKHADPKVRTLAIAALNHKVDPKILPLLIPLCEDSAATLPHPALIAMIPGMDKELTPLDPQTVGDFPKAILKQYLSAAGYQSIKDFDNYWVPRKDRSFCASWFKVQLDRATQHTTPVPASRARQLQALRARIDQLPEKDRAWTMLYLSVPDHVLYDEPTCLAAAKSLGADALLQALRGRCPSTDPDLHARAGGDDPVDPLNLWVLQHAKEILQPKHANLLLEIERGLPEVSYPFRPMQTPWYAIAAANLAPARSKEMISDAFKRFPREGYKDAWARADLASALWRLQGLASSADLINWFYGETLKDEGAPHSRSKFLQSLDPTSADTRKLLTALIADPRFATLDWSSLKSLIHILNHWTTSPVVSSEDLQSLHHPYGEQHVVQQPDQASQIYPTQTKELNRTLDNWRQKIKESTTQWSH